MPPDAALRWWIVSLFVLSTAINYLDRQTLAIVAPLVREEFGLSYAEYGWIIAAFSITYAAAAPFAGLLIDRVGLDRGITLAVAVWSLAGIATGFTQGLGGLVVCRAVLGLAEAGGIPAAGKAIHRYLLPAERAIGNGLNQAGVSLGLILATPVATWLSLRYQWRMAFVVTGVLGLLWIPAWRWGSRRHPAPPVKSGDAPLNSAAILRDRRTWGFIAANALSMIVYSVWTNFTTLYLVDVSRLSFPDAARYSWVPPLFALIGGFAGGWLSLRWIQRGAEPIPARRRVCLLAAVVSLVTAAIPLASAAVWATAGMSLALLAVSAFSVNLYSMPLDAFGARAAFAVSLLVASYGAIQTVISPIFGALIDAYGFSAICVGIAVMPLAGYGVLQWTARS